MKYEFSSTYHDFLFRRDTAIAFMLSLLALFYVVKLLIVASVKFYPTIYRVTYIQFFNEPVSGSLSSGILAPHHRMLQMLYR